MSKQDKELIDACQRLAQKDAVRGNLESAAHFSRLADEIYRRSK